MRLKKKVSIFNSIFGQNSKSFVYLQISSWRELHTHKTNLQFHSTSCAQNILLSAFYYSASSSMQPINCADPLNHLCFSQENYSANSPYGTNLNGFVSLLSIKVPSTGFGLGSKTKQMVQPNAEAMFQPQIVRPVLLMQAKSLVIVVLIKKEL